MSYSVGTRPWSETAAGTSDGPTATHAAETDVTHFVTSVSGHVDEDNVIQIKDGSTVVWESKIDISVEGTQIISPSGLLVPCTSGNACSAVLGGSASDSQINMNGYSIP